MTAANIAFVLLAAGLSRRMGRDKLLRRLPNGTRLLEDRIHMINGAGAVPYVAVPNEPRKPELVAARSAIPVCVPSNAQGMGDSISAAVRALPNNVSGILIMLSDLPDVTSDDLRALMDRFDGETILRATSQNGMPGHPVIFPVRYRRDLEALSGPHGAQALLRSERVDIHPLPGQNAVQDLDTLDDWKTWETARLTTPKK